MIITQARIGRTTIKIEQDCIDGLYTVLKGRHPQWVTDNINSAIEYYNQLINRAA